MIKINFNLQASDFTDKLKTFWPLSGQKILSIEQSFKANNVTPVFTADGKYTTRGWTEWTQGFQYGSAILQFDATNDEQFLEIGRKNTVERMAPHISHVGVHDHGFNNVSTYGNLLRLIHEEKIKKDHWQENFYELALKISGAVQAHRYTKLNDKEGFLYSFNGPHSLFVDTIRSCRALVLSHKLGHVFQAEGDVKVNLLERAVQHILATAKYSVYYGEGRDTYDVSGRTAHESIFNTNDGNYRCPNSQQGYTGFSTWTRGLAWAITGFAEQLECFAEIDKSEFDSFGNKAEILKIMLNAAKATADFYIENTPNCGIPYWDTGAPNLHKMDDYLNQKANPYNEHEPVDSSAAAIAAQGFLRLGKYLNDIGENGKKYIQCGLTITQTLFQEPYLSFNNKHQGLIFHSIYHRPNGWDYVPAGSKIPNGESSMWGDYHARELALYLQKIIKKEPYYQYFNTIKS